MKKNTNTNIDPEVKKLLEDTLFQYFYIFGIDPEFIDIYEFYDNNNFFEKDFVKPQLISIFPPFNRTQSNIDTNVILAHCFPCGFTFLVSKTQPEDEYFSFNLNNMLNLELENIGFADMPYHREKEIVFGIFDEFLFAYKK